MDRYNIIRIIRKVNCNESIFEEIDNLDFKEYVSIVSYLFIHDGFEEAEKIFFPLRNDKLFMKHKTYRIINGGISIPFTIEELYNKLMVLKSYYQKIHFSNVMQGNGIYKSKHRAKFIKRI
ncbi:hypothetical protein AB9O43_001896 [Salmonella enterica]|uniref:hypothetical protein n=1 Tax=Citrobacter koseri TaxID=545 RepID=UPI002942D38F|nr:hypothetical protein [Citrobacter koseri]EFR2204875.1 hypothetical protein [Salmonella enterica]WOI99990.1 hypothetical protein R1158_07570 [Citrobacter koseri]HCR9765994.1 hypothetical protein [Citrobacter koseri]HEM7946814.1 hypothetical protein [Citrobacter koseri]